MVRPLRIEYEGAFYHVLSRGNNQQAVFVSDFDRYAFLKTLGRMSDRFEVEIIAFVLMDNHYHLLLQTHRANLSKAMQWLGTTYTTIFNLYHSQKGHLFQGRYKSILVENEPYLIRLSCYIHRNPLRAGIVQRLLEYPWSSYPAYAYNQQRPDWLNTELITSQFGAGSLARKAYREKVQQYAKEKKSIWEDIKNGVIYGSQAFVDRITTDYLGRELEKEIPVRKKMVADIEKSEIFQAAAAILSIDVEELKNTRRVGKSAKIKRDMLIYLLWQSGLFSNNEIGSRLGLTISSISRRVGIFRELLNCDRRLKANFEKFKSIIKV